MSSTFKNEKRVPRSVILIQYFLEHLLSLKLICFTLLSCPITGRDQFLFCSFNYIGNDLLS